MIIIGGGPAGYAAALYTARANLEPLVFEGFQWGGQLQNTTDVENYPGYPEGIMGPEMMTQFRAQAERFGTRFVTDDVDRVELSDGDLQRVFIGDEEHLASTVILAMGAEPRRLGIPGELELGGRGVSTCGVCDGAFFKGQKVIVIGGGDSAMEDSIFISKYASELTIVHRRDEFRASKIMFERAVERPNISLKTPFVPEEFIAGEDGKLARVRLRNAETGETEEIEAGGAFVAIGHIPRSEVVAGAVETDENGYVVTEPGSTRTNLGGRVRGRRPRRPHLSPGRHRSRHRLHGRARRRVVPARHASLARGPLGQGRRAGRGRADPERRVRRRSAGGWRRRPANVWRLAEANGGIDMAAIESPEKVGLRPFHEFDEANETWPRGERPAAIREAAAAFRDRFAIPENRVRGIRTVDIASAGYPLKFAFGGAAIGPNPYINIINRLQVVQYEDFEGELRTLAYEPTVTEGPAGGALLPADDRAHPRLPGGAATSSPTRCCRRSGTRSHSALAETGLRAEDVDFVSFDHLHVQDVRFILGSSEPIAGPPGGGRPAVPQREAADPAARMGHLRLDPPDAVGLVRRERDRRRRRGQRRPRSTATSSSARGSPWSGLPATPTATTRSASTPRTASGSAPRTGSAPTPGIRTSRRSPGSAGPRSSSAAR